MQASLGKLKTPLDGEMQTNQPSSCPSPPPPATRQNKVLSQREYREREMESFNTLRELIRILTGEELRTRQEILKKAIDLLLSLSGIGDLPASGTQASGNSNPHQLPSSIPGFDGTTSAYSASPSTSYPSHWPQTWPSNSGFSTATHNHHLHQQSQFTLNTDTTFNQFNSLGFDDPYNNRQFGRPP